MRSIPRRLPLHATVAALALGACSAPPAAPERVGETIEAIVNGAASPVSQNFAVLVEHQVSCGVTGCIVDECTGTLIAPNLVLTARHCVSTTTDQAFTCDSTGHGSSGGDIQADFPPASIAVFVGTSRAVDLMNPSAVGARLFHDGATNLCNHDLALIGLSQSIAGVPIATLRETPPSAGDAITAVGWGATTTSNSPATRQQRTNIPILDIGPFAGNNGEDVPPSEFDVGESVCQGDSGSPALDGTGAVIGVASRGGNNTVPDPNDLGASCVGGKAFNSYSQVAAFRGVIDEAFAAMGQKPSVAQGGLFGDSCSGPAQCSSGLCAGDVANGLCSQSCSDTVSCPSGFACVTSAGPAMCEPSGGCNMGRSRSPDAWIVCTGFAALAFARRRRRRGSS